jgi:hypothetical protein
LPKFSFKAFLFRAFKGFLILPLFTDVDRQNAENIAAHISGQRFYKQRFYIFVLIVSIHRGIKANITDISLKLDEFLYKAFLYRALNVACIARIYRYIQANIINVSAQTARQGSKPVPHSPLNLMQQK